MNLNALHIPVIFLAFMMISVDGARFNIARGRSVSYVPGVGEACRGGAVGRQGDCGTVDVFDFTGDLYPVNLYCYNTQQDGRPNAKSSWGRKGTCFVPNLKRCNIDAECRPGTYCLENAAKSSLTCQEAHFPHTSDELAHQIAATVQYFASSLQAALQEKFQGFVDTRSGVVSPLLANPEWAEAILKAMSASFAEVKVPDLPDGSRSGADFFLSSDGRFIVKSIRQTEMQKFNPSFIEQLARRSGLLDRNLSCNHLESLESCWAETLVKHTLLNLPLMAFSSNEKYWLVMPTAEELRGLATSHSIGRLQPWGPAEYYDVKPVWAKSNDRPRFNKLLSQLQLHPLSKNAPVTMQRQWQDLLKLLAEDLELLAAGIPDGHTGDEAFIDYSLLFELYQPLEAVKEPGPGCIASHPCFSSNFSDCRVVCVTIIDYLTTYSSKRKLESIVKRFKFSNYANRTMELFSCSFAHNYEITGKLNSMETSSETSLHVTARLTQAYGSAACAPYLKMACGDIDLKIVSYSGCDKPPRPPACARISCEAILAQTRVQHCSLWLQSECQRRLHKFNEVVFQSEALDRVTHFAMK